jgi:hypothetical protein
LGFRLVGLARLGFRFFLSGAWGVCGVASIRRRFSSSRDSSWGFIMSKNLPIQEVLTEEHFCAIGLVIAEWARAERSIFLTLSQIGGMQIGADTETPTGLVILLASGMDPRTSMGILQGIVRRSDEAGAEEFDKLKSRFEKVYKRRNIVAHGVWRTGKRPKAIGTTSLKSVGDVRFDDSEYTPLEMIALAHRIHAFRGDLIKFFRKRGYWKRRPSREIPGKQDPEQPEQIG